MKWITGPIVIALALAAPAAGYAHGVRVPIAAQGDGSTNGILLSHPFLNGNANALLLVMGSDFNNDYGFQPGYSSAWWIYNVAAGAIPSSAHVWILAFDSASGFRHTTTVGNTPSNDYYTVLDDPRLNNKPGARPIVTAEATGGHAAIPYPYGTEYDVGSQRWRIRYVNSARIMPTNATFTVFVPDAEDVTYSHTTTVGNTNANYTIFSPVGIDSSHQYRLFASQHFPGVVNEEWTGAAWLFSNLIGNVDGTTMPAGVVFHVYAAPIFEDGFELGNSSLWSAAVP